jgi:superfamily II DNA or RNA helicase
VFVAPPGVGKTVVGIHLIAARACSTLVLVHRRPLLDQWLAQLSVFLGIDSKEIGQIGAGRRTPTGRIDVAMIQSLVRNGAVADLVAAYGQVIVDECHHLPAVSFERVLAEVKARYVVGLTATPQRRDGHHPITQMQLGPVRFSIDAKTQAGRRPFEHRLIIRETAFRMPGSEQAPGIQEVYAAFANDERRNEMILNDVIGALEDGRSPILLTERKDHLEYFATRLARVARHLVVLQGGLGAKAQRAVRAKLAAIPVNEERLVLATGRYLGEGFDDARLDTLFLAMPVSWKGTLVQYTGRLHRLHPGKTEVRIFDYVDREVPMLLRMFEKRLRGYRAIGYARGEAPLGYSEPRDEIVVEYDEDVLAALDREDNFT